MFHHAGEWPIIETMVPTNMWDNGMGQPIIARRMPDGNDRLRGLSLLDTYCLGVKDAMYNILSPLKYREFFDKLEQESAARSRSLRKHSAKSSPIRSRMLGHSVSSRIRITKSLGCSWPESTRLFQTERFEFGKDGKPLYIQGPHDSPGKAAAIGAKIQAAGGNYVMVLGGTPDDLEEEDLDVNEPLDD